MTLIDWPATNPFIGFQKYTLKLDRKTISMKSPFTGKRQALIQPYALWNFKGTFATQYGVNAGELRSFLTQLSGQANTFKLPVPDAQYPISGYTGWTGVVNGAGQTGTSIVTDGWTPSTLVLSNGDHFTLNGELKVNVGYAVSDGSGNCTLNFLPPIRNSPADNLQLFIGNAINLLSQTATFGSNWIKTNCTVVAALAGSGPGGTNPYKIVRTATGNCAVFTQSLQTVVYNTNYTFSVWLKRGTLTGDINLIIEDGAGGNVQTAVVTPTAGWRNFSVTGSLPAGATLPLQVGINPQNTAGSAGDTLFLYGPQLETGNGGKPYAMTTTGDGQPYVIMHSTDDDVASLDLTPPIKFDADLNAEEDFS